MSSEYALVFTFDGDGEVELPPPGELRAALGRTVLPEGVDRAQLFSPHPEHARLELFGDGPPPFAIVEWRSGRPDALGRLARAAGAQALLGAGGAARRWRAGLFRVLSEPVPAPTDPGARPAPVSLVVHYYGPSEDPPAFAAHYVAHHPAILARLPQVREVLCYLPFGPKLPGLRADPSLIRNEVRFDTMDDLLAALRSPVMQDLRADTMGFPRFGRSTHHPMRRQPLG